MMQERRKCIPTHISNVKGGQMKAPTVFLFRSPEGKIESARGQSAHEAAHMIGQVLSWDADLNTLDIVRHGKTEVWAFIGHREQAVKARNQQCLADLRRIFGVKP